MPDRIPLYTADGELSDWISERRLARLQAAGLIARVVRHRKGHINRAILFRRAGESRALQPKDYMGTRYSFREQLASGHFLWQLKRLGRGAELRPLFLQVAASCLSGP